VRFTSIYADWLRTRQERLEGWFRSLPALLPTNVLLLNATKGQQLYPSVVDFFAALQRVQPNVRVTSVSYFDEIFDLARGAAEKGLEVVPVSEMTSWSLARLNRFDVVLAVGPSEAFATLIRTRGLRPRLVCLDLAFYHQLIEASGGAFLREERVVPPLGLFRNPVVCYSCQPELKVHSDLARAGFLRGDEKNSPEWRWVHRAARRWRFRWFDYIPLGFGYQTYYASDRTAFDVALLGASGRSYEDLDPAALRGRKVLFLGKIEGSPELEQLAAEVPMTVVPRVDEDTYARLVALCRCVVLPMHRPGTNVLLSVVDSLAAGKLLVTARLPGLARIEREGAPIAFYDVPEDPQLQAANRPRLSATLARVLGDDDLGRAMGARAIAFAKERLDIYVILRTILRDEVLPSARAS
jgi:hypothetical protein